MALREKPQRKDFPMGLLGNRQYQRALAQYVGSDKPKPKPPSTTARPNRTQRRKGASSKIDSSKYDIDSQPPKGPNQVKPAKPAAAQPSKPKPKPAQPAAAKPKPKPKPETVNGKTVKRVGPVNTPADKPKMNKLKIEKATAPTEKAYLKYLQEQAKKKSLEQAKKNRARGSRPRGPRG